jgi:RNA polymerase-binding transcription factor DksA
MDVIDRANDLAAEDLAHRIAAATRAKPRGPAECDDCGDTISDLRRDLGARRCITCQEAHEHRAGSGRPA